MESNELIVSEAITSEIFTETKIAPLLQRITDRTKELASGLDPKTENGRTAMKSLAYKVSRNKTFIVEKIDETVARYKYKVKRAAGVKKKVEAHCDALRDETRKPVNDMEAAEAKKKAEADEKERVLIQNRVNALQEYEVVMSVVEVAILSDEDYNILLAESAKEFQAEQDRLAQEESDRKAEADRLEKQRLDQEEAQKKIDDANAKIATERQALEDEKKAEQEKKAREEFEKQAKIQAEIDATAKADREAEEAAEEADRKEQEAEDKAEADEKEKARQEALKPDKVKLQEFADKLLEIDFPVVHKPIAVEVLDNVVNLILEAARRLNADIKAM